MFFELKAAIKEILTNFFRCKGVINSEFKVSFSHINEDFL